MRAPARCTGSPRFLRGEAIRKESPGGSENVREALGFSTPHVKDVVDDHRNRNGRQSPKSVPEYTDAGKRHEVELARPSITNG